MKKPNPVTIIIICVAAVSILAFTINDELKNRRKNTFVGASANAPGASPFVAYNPPHGKPGHRHDLPDGAPLPGVVPNQTSASASSLPFLETRSTQTATAASGAVALNPAHGQPGHRCEIAVGAPLNTAPVNQGITAAPAASLPAAGKNPEHGKPGHRCDIAVGAPLDSAPAKTTASSPASATPSTVAATVAPGMNPAHGQPGHRCDIAVGAPLNSAKAATATAASTTNASTPQLFPNYNFLKNDSAVITPQITLDSTTSK